MARVGVSVVKRVSFRLAQQEFANVYHYEGGTLNAVDASNLLASIKAIEVDLHSTDVTFVRGSVWSAGGTPVSNNMIFQGSLSGTGSQATNTSMDRERAVLVQWAAGLDIRGRPVFLRKWYHSCGSCAAISFVAAELQQTGFLDSTKQNTIAAKADDLQSLTIGANNLDLVSPTGRTRTGGATVHRWLEHHQLGDMWR